VIGERLGQGGFGITYRGFDLKLRMKVAIKE
jgi:serine/threonine protein kinase